MVASGSLDTVLPVVKARFDEDRGSQIAIFNDANGKPVDFDLRGALSHVVARAKPAPPRSGPGRPKLGVVAREISLLPRHWEWLEEQPNGASAAIRRLIDQARKNEPEKQRARLAREAAGRFLTAIVGDAPGFEETMRALYAPDKDRFFQLIQGWPEDVRSYAQRLTADAFSSDAG